MLRYLLAALLVALAAYGAKEALPLLTGPVLAIASPANGFTAPLDGIFTVSGTVERATALTLDGAPLLQDQNGSFSSTLTLPPGGAILTLVATDRFGRTVTKTRSVYVP